MSPRQDKYRLLLDEMFPRRNNFHELNQYHDLKHVIHDFRLRTNTDDKVVALAKSTNRILISKNKKHMIELCRMHSVTLICITETMTYEEIDTLIMAKLRHFHKSDHLIKISKPIRKM